MNISLESIIILDAIDRRGSFAAAAEELHRVPSAITYGVRQLEESLNVALFDRSGHRAVLTPAGEELLREGRRLLEAANTLEQRVKRVASGYEAELRIAISDLISIERFYPLVERFYKERCGTRLRLMTEVFGGSWDALVSGRADLSVGAPGEGPPGGGYSVQLMGQMKFVFAVAPNHPLAKFGEPLGTGDISPHRAVSAADSSRNLPPRTSGLLSGQDVLTVPDMAAKVEAQIKGLGVGYLPQNRAKPEVAAGRLKIMKVAERKPEVSLYLALPKN